MALYGLLGIDRDGKLVARRSAEYRSDAEAIGAARAMLGRQAAEISIFQGDRRVETVRQDGGDARGTAAA